MKKQVNITYIYKKKTKKKEICNNFCPQILVSQRFELESFNLSD